MAVNALPPSTAPVPAPMAAGKGGKGEEGNVDATFASLLAAMIGPMLAVPMTLPDNAAANATKSAPAQPAAAQISVAGLPQAAASPILPGPLAGQPAAALQQAKPLVVPVPPEQAGAAFVLPAEAGKGQPVAAVPQGATAIPAASQGQAQAAAVQALQTEPVPTAVPVAQVVAGQPAVALQTGGTSLIKASSSNKGAEPNAKIAPNPGPVVAEVAATAPEPMKPLAGDGHSSGQEQHSAQHQALAPEKDSARHDQAPVHLTALQTPVVRTPEEHHPALEQIPNPVDPDRLMNAIGQSMASSRPGHYTVTLQLYPESLGEVRLQLQLVGREVHTVMQVDNPAAKQVLEDRGEQLRQSLTQSGLTLSGFQVSTGQGGQTPQDRRNQIAEQVESVRRVNRVSGVRVTRSQVSVQRSSGDGRTGGHIDKLA